MTTSATCPKCGAALPPDAPQGLCPACLMAGGFATEAETVKLGVTSRPPTSAGLASAPAIEELAPHFPQLEILELLGRGGMGAVYKARQKNLNRLVALKVLPVEAGTDPHFAERFQREAQALARLNHPNIVGVFDFGESGGHFYFLMEYVDGANLRTLMHSGEMKPEAALALIPPFCDALQYAHDEGVVHRDIKPENVLVDKKGRIKIADFGLAKLLGHGAALNTLTRTGTYLGTPRYMAPEQMDKPEAVDHRADIYSLGVVFYEMLTGEVPMGRFDPPSKKVQVDVKLDEIVLHALERDVDRRYQHASEVKTDLENLSGVLQRMPIHIQRMLGFEFRSKRTLFGLPLLHVAVGLDPATGRGRIAKGIVAIGGRAFGVVAFGGFAVGGFACGGLGIGLLSFSGLALGLLVGGGLALGLVFAFGGIAVAPFALGGLAVGWVAAGGSALGAHVMDGSTKDPLAKEFFDAWQKHIFTLFYCILPLTLCIPIVVGILGRRTAVSADADQPKPPSATGAAHSPAKRTPVPNQKVIRAHTMGPMQWMLTSHFTGKYGPGEWREAIVPQLLFLALCVADLTLFRFYRHFTQNVNYAVIAEALLFLVVNFALYFRLWRKYRRIKIDWSGSDLVSFESMPADIRNGIRVQAACALVALVAAIYFVTGVLNHFIIGASSWETNYHLRPNSNQYLDLVLRPQFATLVAGGRTFSERPGEWQIAMELKPNAGEPMLMTVKFPSLLASYWHPNHMSETPQYYESVLDFDSLTTWMGKRCKVEMNDAAQNEARQIMALLKSFREKPPAVFREFEGRVRSKMPDFVNTHWGSGSGEYGMPILTQSLIPAILIFLPIYVFAVGQINRKGMRLARSRLGTGNETSAVGGIPPMRLAQLPPDIRSSARWRLVFASLAFALAVSLVIWSASARPIMLNQSYLVTLQPNSSVFEKLTLEFSFDTCDWRGSRYDVVPDQFPVKLSFFHPPGSRLQMQVDLSNLEMSFIPKGADSPRTVIFDEEELRNWVSLELGLDVRDPGLERNLSDLTRLFKFSGQPPENVEAFEFSIAAMGSFNPPHWEKTASQRIDSGIAGYGLVIAALLALFATVAYGIKRAAASAAIERTSKSNEDPEMRTAFQDAAAAAAKE